MNDNQNYDIQIESDEFDNDSDEKSLFAIVVYN
jgi:hypothetical protein